MLAKLMGLFLLGLIRLLTGSQARWVGCPPKAEQRIYFANHQSHADLLLVWAASPRDLRGLTRPIAARDYWTKTPFRQWITSKVFNAIYVSRERTADQDPLEPLIEALGNGDSVLLFPEGTRGHAEEPQAFKSGLYNLAQRFAHLVLVVQVCMVVQFFASRRLNRPPAAPGISRSFNWPSWLIGVVVASLLGGLLAGITPFAPGQAFALSLVACIAGSLGHLVMKAIKRDRGIPNWGEAGASVTGTGGLLDRVDALCFAAPVFFHSVRWYFDL